jgi:predicted Zn-dependent protease
LYDWDWDIPGVTLPALLFAGVLAGSANRGSGEPRRVRTPGPAARLLGLGAAAAVLCSVALSGVVPSVAATKARSALVAAAGSSPAALANAQSTAAAAARLDPLSDAGLLAEATIALHRGQLQQPRAYLLEAIRRDPEDLQAWRDLASFEFSIGDLRAAVSAIGRVMQLDPRGAESLRYARVVGVISTPPVDSAASTPVG